MKNLHELSRCMTILSNYYDRKNGKNSFAKLDDEALETLTDCVGDRIEGEPSYGSWGLACALFFNS